MLRPELFPGNSLGLSDFHCSLGSVEEFMKKSAPLGIFPFSSLFFAFECSLLLSKYFPLHPFVPFPVPNETVTILEPKGQLPGKRK